MDSPDKKTEAVEMEYNDKRATDDALAIDPAVEKSLLRKLDFRVMPVFFVMYFFNHWDRNGLPQARLNGLEDDLGLKGEQYNACISILYVGYLLAGIPSNMLLTRIRPSIYLGVCMCGWAIVSACTTLAENYVHLLMLRFLLGFLEAPFYPGAIYLIGRFYTKKEVASRLAILYCGQLLSSSFSGLLTAAIFATLDGRYGIVGWKWLFIIEGVVTFGIAAISVFILPDAPGKTPWMSDEENHASLARATADNVAKEEKHSPLEGFLSAMKDPKVWLFIVMQNLHFSAMSFNQFFPTIVKTLGYNSTITLVLTAPPYVAAALFGLGLAWSSGRFNERTYHIVGGNVLAIVGFILACTTKALAPRYVSCFLFAAGSYSTGSIILGWASATVTESPEKKAVTLASVNFAAVLANVYTAYLWPSSDGPTYLMGLGSSAGFSAVCAVMAVVTMLVLKAKNRKILREYHGDDARLYVL